MRIIKIIIVTLLLSAIYMLIEYESRGYFAFGAEIFFPFGVLIFYLMKVDEENQK